ncbi:hypothetical protein QQY66_49125 [Streptomyces sp. DG2A-72]|uniref:hypothetical protein n=1 Tax=Streptomyces sp. DG2A-72 TaxID=3051386 RepID=UPI00265C6BBD|nr:hypothetical protein [Streptomyces sp. DG2A-72]MDO0939277.1 hypothetical protein [Streptomyces sp. DG2A-72]
MGESSTEARVAAAVQRNARWRAWWEAETAITAIMSDPEVRRLGEEVRQEETRLGLELRPRLQPLQDQYDRAVREGNIDALTRTCHGKHGRWGRICVLAAGHESVELHWGITAEGQPVAWVGSAPDDD